MSTSFDEEFFERSSSSESEASIESSDSFYSTVEEVSLYDESLEPIATPEEIASYIEQLAHEEDEEDMLWSRFSGEVDVRNWCKCSNCSLEFVVKPDECRCCTEIDRCTEKMQEIEMDGSCITMHSGFYSVCLNRWVLQTAGVGLRTKRNKSYSSIMAHQGVAENEFFRSVSYRQFVRFVWDYVGASNRLPLPSCVYAAIRKVFPTTTEQYHGYEEDED